MKTIVATGKYIVSFNISYGDYNIGDDRADSIDHAGDDIDRLAEEVIVGDETYPLKFIRNEDQSSSLIGLFYHIDDDPSEDGPTAIMYLD